MKTCTCPVCGSKTAQQTTPNRIWCEACGWVTPKGELLDG